MQILLFFVVMNLIGKYPPNWGYELLICKGCKATRAHNVDGGISYPQPVETT